MTPIRSQTPEEVQPLIASGKLLRIAVLVVIAVQLVVNWAVPMLVGGASDAQRAILGLDASDGIGYATRTGFGIYALVVGMGHLLSLIRPRVQTFFGLLHAVACVVIGVRLVQVGFAPAGFTYVFGWASLGIIVAITAERKAAIAVG